MMKTNRIKLFAFLGVMLMLFSIIPAGAIVIEDDGDTSKSKSKVRDRIETMEQIRENDTEDGLMLEATSQMRAENVQSIAARYKASRENLQNANNQYLIAKKDFQKIRAEAAGDSEEVFEVTCTYLVSTVDYMISYLENVKEDVESSDGELAEETSELIDGYIEQLEQERENIEAAETRKELVDAGNSIREIWKNANKDASFRAGKAANNKINVFLAKSELISLRLQSEIQRLKDEGKDTDELEKMLVEYNNQFELATQNQEQAMLTFQNRNADEKSIKEANNYLREAGKNIKEANRLLNDIVKELKVYRRGVVKLDGTGTLTAEGSGTAVLSGDLILNIDATDAKLVIKDLAGDAEVEFSTDADYIQMDSEADDNSAMIYHEFTGTVGISGSRLTVMIRGEDVNLTAEGTGNAVLSGTGTYSVEKDGISSATAQWAAVVTESTEEAGEEPTETEEDTQE
ncbi:MAG: hypothetical protein JXA38_04695 [Methanosarcinaceae archaeon]|nr:hypothetical protein [Methanosarcinaceae archaeon]